MKADPLLAPAAPGREPVAPPLDPRGGPPLRIAFFTCNYRPLVNGLHQWDLDHWNNWIASITLFVICLLQIQVGLQQRAPFMVNLGVTFVALHIFTTYLILVGSMARTGVMFLVSGVFLIAFGIYLEKKRRALLQRMKVTSSTA